MGLFRKFIAPQNNIMPFTDFLLPVYIKKYCQILSATFYSHF